MMDFLIKILNSNMSHHVQYTILKDILGEIDIFEAKPPVKRYFCFLGEVNECQHREGFYSL